MNKNVLPSAFLSFPIFDGASNVYSSLPSAYGETQANTEGNDLSLKLSENITTIKNNGPVKVVFHIIFSSS